MTTDGSTTLSASLAARSALGAAEHGLSRAWRRHSGACRDALFANLRPGIALQALAAAFVGTYALVPAARPLFTAIADAKRSSGFLGSALLLLGAGAIAPTLVASWRGRWPARRLCLTLAAQSVVWLLLGALTDAMYLLQDRLFTDLPAAAAIVVKVAVDQFVWTPLIPVPTFIVLDAILGADFAWREAFSGPALRAAIARLPTVLLANWMVWIPTTALIYALPRPLQVPLCALAVCFWSMMLGQLRARRAGAHS